MLERIHDPSLMGVQEFNGPESAAGKRQHRPHPERAKRMRLRNRRFCKAALGALAPAEGVATLAESLDPVNQNWHRFLRECRIG